MSTWLIAAACGLVIGILSYAARGISVGRVAVPAALRALAVALLVALLLDAVTGARRPIRPIVALDASASWTRGRAGTPWTEAVRLARARAGDSLFLIGDSARVGRPTDRATDLASR